MKIAVTGATGRLGGGIVDALLQRGAAPENIVPIARNAEKAARFMERGMSPRLAAFEDRDALQAAFEGMDKLIVISPPELNNGLRLRQIQNAIFAAVDAKVGHLINVGLVAPEKQAFGLEDVELSIEPMIRCLGIPYTLLRNTVYFDELKAELQVAAQSGELVSATNGQPLNWLLRQDMALATAVVADSGDHLSKGYDLTSTKLYTYEDLAKALGEVVGRPIVNRYAEPEAAIGALVNGGVTPRRAASIVNSFQGSIVASKFIDEDASIEVLTGRKPDLVESIRRLLG